MLTTDGPMTYSKAPFYSTMSFTALSAIIIALIIISSLIYWIILMISGWFKRSKNKSFGLSSFARWVGICTSITILVLFASMFSAGIDPVYQLPKEAYLPVEGTSLPGFIPTLIGIFSCLLVPFTVVAWWKGFWGRIARVHYSIFTLAVLGLIWIINYWNLFK
jgi:hypothetical protein